MHFIIQIMEGDQPTLKEVARACARTEDERTRFSLRLSSLQARSSNGGRPRVGHSLDRNLPKWGRRGEVAGAISKSMMEEHYTNVGDLQTVRGRAGRCSVLRPLCGGHLRRQLLQWPLHGPGPAPLAGQHRASACLKQARPPRGRKGFVWLQRVRRFQAA